MPRRSAKPKLRWSDAWILLAYILVGRDKGSAPLTDVIACADYVQHAIVTREELELSIGALLAEGYLLKGKGGFRPSAKARRLWERSASREKRVLGALQRVREGIGAADWEPGPLPTTTSQEYVHQPSYERALADYLARVGRKSNKRRASS